MCVSYIQLLLFRCEHARLQVVLSAPAENKSGTGSSTATPVKLQQPCEFNTCPTGSPAEGFNATDSEQLSRASAFRILEELTG